MSLQADFIFLVFRKKIASEFCLKDTLKKKNLYKIDLVKL